MKRDSNTSSTVLRAFRVLETVANLDQPATAAEIGRNLDMDRVTAYRMLRTLEEAGYVRVNPDSKKFVVANRALALARPLLDAGEQTERIDDLLRAVVRETGETCHYSELSGTETVLTRRAKGSQLVAVDFKIGTRCELHATSVGKAILAHQTNRFVDDYLKLELARYTERTVVEPDLLRSELSEIQHRNAAFDFEELSGGMNCVAVPIRSHGGVVEAGISISGPTLRLTPSRLVELSDLMKAETASAGF